MLELELDSGLPVLRSDIQLFEAPMEREGMPSWTLYDPAANKYYKIGWMEFECLGRFKHVKNVGRLIEKVNTETTLAIDLDDIKSLVFFLIFNNLVQSSGDQVAEYFESERKRKKRPWWERVLHSYLFFTLPLFKPRDFLKKTYPFVKPFFTQQFMMLVLCLLFYGIFLSIQRFDELAATFMNYFSFEGAVLFLFSTIIIKFVHEFGHAYAATKYGVPVTTIGIAFIVLYPVLYTETTNAWRMKNRRQRIFISLAGVLAELSLAAIALIMWHYLSPGPLQSLCFMVAVVSMLASIFINFNPLMRFDGYYLFSDIVGVDNLQDRSIAIMKWRLRRFLWGWDDEPPETLSRKSRNMMLSFGIAMCIYRFFLFVGIAIIVYHIFFKPLGLILMLVELAFFIGMPIFREMRVWKGRFDEIWKTGRGRITLGITSFIFVLCLLPVYNRVEIPAVLHASVYNKIYAPVPARIEEILVQSGERVEKGQILFRLSSPEVEFNIQLLEQRLSDLRNIKDSSQATLELAQKRMTLEQEITAAEKELLGYRKIHEQLIIRSNFEGVVKDVELNLQVGQWINTDLQLAYIVNHDDYKLTGYIKEKDASRLLALSSGTFYPEFSPARRYDVQFDRIDHTALDTVFWAELASPFNGSVPAELSAGQLKTLPRYTFYTVDFSFDESVSNARVPDFVARGTIVLNAVPTSLAIILIQKINNYFLQDSES